MGASEEMFLVRRLCCVFVQLLVLTSFVELAEGFLSGGACWRSFLFLLPGHNRSACTTYDTVTGTVGDPWSVWEDGGRRQTHKPTFSVNPSSLAVKKC